MDLKREFREIDTDNSGFISEDEFRSYVQKTFDSPVSRKMVNFIFKQVDLDSSGKISFEGKILKTFRKIKLIIFPYVYVYLFDPISILYIWIRSPLLFLISKVVKPAL